jgi:hypothetical protein
MILFCVNRTQWAVSLDTGKRLVQWVARKEKLLKGEMPMLTTPSSGK